MPLASPTTTTPETMWLIVVFAGLLGAAVGSFLNVVVYRLPRRMSLVHPGSHCPRCQHPIRPRDNVPVLGWLLLRGKCRDCGAAISPRYPLVEAASAGMFLWVAVFEVARAHLPGLTVGSSAEPREWRLGESLELAAFHAALLAFMLCAGLIRRDGLPLPRGIVAAAGALALAAPLWSSFLRPSVFGDFVDQAAVGQTLLSAAAGLATGLVISAIRRLGPLQRSDACPFADAASFWGVVGLFLGWQGTLITAAVAFVVAVIYFLLSGAQRQQRSIPFELFAIPGALAFIATLPVWLR